MDCFIGGVIAINAGPNLVGLIYRKNKTGRACGTRVLRRALFCPPGPGGRRKESGEEIPGIYILFILFVIGWTMLWKTEGIDVIL